MEIQGHCLCGRVTYRCDQDPVLTGVCHCTDCQQQTGAASSIIVGVPSGALEVTGDSQKTFVTIGEDHDTATNRTFCSECGSPIVSRIDAMPDLAFIKAGTLDDTSWLMPTIEFWCRSAQPWEQPIPGAQRLDRASA
jgi:hypothetical protein